MKANLEKDMGPGDESSGYGSDTSSLVEEGSLNYTSYESGVFFMSSPSKGLSSISESSQLVRSQAAAGQRKALLSPTNGEQQGRVEEQQEEEELPWVPVHCQAGFESGGASRPPEAPVHPHLLGVAPKTWT